MQLTLAAIDALEILDSRSRPTLTVTVMLTDGTTARAGVPSGASTGTREAVELRDGDTQRFGGSGVLTAVGNVTGEIREALVGRTFADQSELDGTLIALDGTTSKSRLGANAVIGVSMAAARAGAISSGQPLWRCLTADGVAPCMPVPHFNVVNGGAHAPNNLDFQEFMLAPLGAPSLAEAVRAGAEIYAVLRRILTDRGFATGLGDEGGFAPEIDRPEEVLGLLVQAITSAGYRPGKDGVAIALDPAASEFYRDGVYHVAGETLSSDEMTVRYEEMVDAFPIWSIEDGLAEQDWAGWERLTARLGETVQIVGDDLLVTNPAIIAEAINAVPRTPRSSSSIRSVPSPRRSTRSGSAARLAGHRWSRIVQGRPRTASLPISLSEAGVDS